MIQDDAPYPVVVLLCLQTILRSGKAMNETKTEVRLQFKSQSGFFGHGADGFRNEFVMQLKPKDLMYLKMVVKKPGLDMDASMSELNLTYQDRCGPVQCLGCFYICLSCV
jgi:glucose-6-phosphate 1-dehydrogenase